jgi:hypothetical protein
MFVVLAGSFVLCRIHFLPVAIGKIISASVSIKEPKWGPWRSTDSASAF